MPKAEPPSLPEHPSIVAIDLDGTLLDSSGVLRERSSRAIEALIERDIRVAIATARPGRAAAKLLGPRILEAIDLVHVDGAVIDRHGKQYDRHRHPLPEGAAETVVRLTSRALPNAHVMVELDGWEFGTDYPITPEQLWKYNSATPDMVISMSAAIERGPVKVAINGVRESVDSLAAELARELGDSVRFIHHRVGTFLSVVAPGVGKHSGIRRLLDGDDAAWSEAIAFGDDYSDIELLEACGYGFAMANAALEVTAVAASRAPTNDDDGVAVILEHLIESQR